VPVIYNDIQNVPTVDVVMCTQTGNWTPYRQWPYFDELKELFKKEDITYIDLNEEGIFSVKLLNYVNRCKLYLGLDTGTSHYVSQFANNKALIIQGGYVTFDFVFHAYHYDHIQIEEMPCSPCFINKNHIERNEGCEFNHKCMMNLSSEVVFEEVRKRII
jgi:hypothetical protein